MKTNQQTLSTSTHAEPERLAASASTGRLADANSPRQLAQSAQISQLLQAESDAAAASPKPTQGGLPEGLLSGLRSGITLERSKNPIKQKIPVLSERFNTATVDQYEKSVDKGKRLIKELNDKLAKSDIVDIGKTKEEFDSQYTTSATPNTKDVTVDVRSDRTASMYEQQYHNQIVNGSEIHAKTNRKDYDIVDTEAKGKSTTAFANSEILFHHFRTAVNGNADSLKALELVRRANVANVQTRSIMMYLQAEDPSKTTFSRPEDAYFALLGTDNGSAVVHMLRDHAKALGLKTVDRVEIVEASLAIHLKTCEKSESSESSVTDTVV